MNDRELDALVAKMMGWKHINVTDRYPVDGTGQSRFSVPTYSTDQLSASLIDLHMASQPEAVVESYIDNLIELTLGRDALTRHNIRGLYGDQILGLLLATPRHKSLAALRAVGVEVPDA